MWNAMRLRFTRNWEKARQAQQVAKCGAAEQEFRNELNKIEQQIDYETRYKNEAELYLLLKIDTTNQNSLRWMEKYDADYEAAEVEIQVTIDEMADLKKKRALLNEEYDRRQGIIDTFHQKQTELAQFEKNLEKYTKNALILQVGYRTHGG